MAAGLSAGGRATSGSRGALCRFALLGCNWGAIISKSAAFGPSGDAFSLFFQWVSNLRPFLTSKGSQVQSLSRPPLPDLSPVIATM